MNDFAQGCLLLFAFLVLMVLTVEFYAAWLESRRWNWRNRGPELQRSVEHPAVRLDEASIRERFDADLPAGGSQ